MATIQLNTIGKKFGTHWLFRNINFEITSGEKIAVTGSNGSGKSTLLQLISGHMRPSEGELTISSNGSKIPTEKWYEQLSWCAPYIDIIEEFSPTEFLNFYREHKSFLNGISTKEIIDLCMLKESALQPINQFSSGMKQRLKLATAILTDAPILLLDEPLSNLDERGNQFYKELITSYAGNKTIIVCSNEYEKEFFFCSRKIRIEDYK